MFLSVRPKTPREETANAKFSAVHIRSVIFKTCKVYVTSSIE